MGNQPSSSSEAGPAKRLGGLLRQSNALGLSKSELDARCRPSGLYPSCHWEEKAIRRLIGDGKLAARMKGSEVRQSEQQQECPICFLNYSEVNVTKCCQAVLCTECYLQIKPQREKSTCCPFCNAPKLQIAVAGAMDESKIRARQQEEARMEEARLLRQTQDVHANKTAAAAEAATLTPAATVSDYSNHGSSGGSGAAAASEGPREYAGFAPPLPQNRSQVTFPNTPNGNSTTRSQSQRDIPLTGFGSSLARNERIAVLRARSESMTSDGTASSDHMTQDLVAVAMTPEERQALHADMQAQANHPLARRLQQEEAERRELAYYRNLSTQHASRMRSRRDLIRQFEETNPPSAQRRDWNRIVDAFESGGNGPVQSLDDLVVLEAAIMLSMQEEEERAAARRTASANNDNNNNNNIEGRDSLSGLSSDYPGGFDAARHASRGFPLARARVQNGRRNFGENDRLSDLVRSFQNRNERPSSSSNNNSSSLSTDHQSLLMRGMTEEEQLAMAIAASLEEQNRNASENQEDSNGNNNDSQAIVVSDSSVAAPSVANTDAARASETSTSTDGAFSQANTDSRAASAGPTTAQSPATVMESAPTAASNTGAEQSLSDPSSANGATRRISQESSPAPP